MSELGHSAYRAFCEARKGAPLDAGEYEAMFSRVEFAWISSVVTHVLREAAEKMRREAGGDECALNDVSRESQLPQSSRIMLNGVTRAAERLRAEAGRLAER